MRKVSVIIPAYNEADNIAGTIEALQRNPSLQIIVVDNGSSDATVDIAIRLGVTVIRLGQGTIAAVRNHGVANSNGDILVFIDADVRVTPQWHEQLPSVIDDLTVNDMLITGSRCLPADSAGLFTRYWYSKLSAYSVNYINSGHLITSRSLFELIGGFTRTLETAEDYDFCLRARRAGAEIRNRPELKVVHEGYPGTLAGFINRERWHGRQDVASWSEFMESKIAWCAAFNLLLFVAAVIATCTGMLLALPVYLLVMYMLSLLLACLKFAPMYPDSFILTPVFFFLYLCGRSLAIVDRMFGVRVR